MELDPIVNTTVSIRFPVMQEFPNLISIYYSIYIEIKNKEYINLVFFSFSTLTKYYRALDFELVFPTNSDDKYSVVWDEVVNQGTCKGAAHKLNTYFHPLIITILSALLFIH